MKVFMRWLLCLLLVLSGCSTVPQPLPQVSGAVIVITRDTGFLGSGCGYQITVNDRKIGVLNSGERMVVQAKLGENTVRMETDQSGLAGAICSNVRMARSVTMDGKPRFFRVGTASNFQIFFEEDTQ